MIALLFLVLCVSQYPGSRCDRIKDGIYTQLEAIKPCFRRLNGTGEVGCTSSIGGEVGVIQYVEQEQQVKERVEEAPQEFSPFIVMLDPLILSLGVLSRLKESGKVAGILLPPVERKRGGRWAGHYPSQGFSADRECPNRESGIDLNTTECTPWNRGGSGAMWQDWGFPIFLLDNSSNAESVYSCWEEHNSKGLQWPACSLQLQGNMYAAKDSPTCLRRSQLFTLTPVTRCDPLSDNSLHFTVRPRNSTSPSNTTVEQAPNSVIVISARLDALAMFDKAEVGFDSPSTGIVTLLAVAKFLSEALKDKEFVNGIENILFLLIHGESFDYIGSSRLLYDMQHDSFPFNLSLAEEKGTFYSNSSQPPLSLPHLHSWLELGQLSPNSTEYVYLHNEKNPGNLVETLRSNADELQTIHTANLPPASLQPFLKSGLDIPHVFISNFENSYSNPMFHSIYDSADSQGFDASLGGSQPIPSHLSKVATMVTKTVYQLATGETLSLESSSSAPLINSLLECYTVTANCSLYREASEPTGFPWSVPLSLRPDHPFPQYVGVRDSSHTYMTKLMLQYLTGEKVTLQQNDSGVTDEESEEDLEEERRKCLEKNVKQGVYSYVFLVGEGCSNLTSVRCGSCYRSTVWATEASSPAFLPWVQDSYVWDSHLYPTWTESIWKTIDGRMFLQAEPWREWLALGLGVTIALLSLPGIWWVDKHAATIFTEAKAGEGDQPVTM